MLSTRRKRALRRNFLLYCVMSVALKLGKDEGEIAEWPRSRLVRWMALFKIHREEEDKAIERAKSGFKAPPGRQNLPSLNEPGS